MEELLNQKLSEIIQVTYAVENYSETATSYSLDLFDEGYKVIPQGEKYPQKELVKISDIENLDLRKQVKQVICSELDSDKSIYISGEMQD